MNNTRMILPCLRGVIGDWVYYSTVMTAKQVADWIMPAKDIREAKALDEILQRDLKERRKDIANYLLNHESRFFNSLIVGVFEGVPDWYEFNFGIHNRLELSNSEMNYLKESVGFLTFNGAEKMFAIDGQHRVAGIDIAYKLDINKNNSVLIDDQYSVLLVAHIDDKSGMKRTRKLFSDININAKPVAKGDRIKIDEENLSAIVTRRLYSSYKYFRNGNVISLTENEKLDENDSNFFTNLLGIYNSINVIKTGLFKKTKQTKEWDEVNVEIFYKLVSSFFDFIFEGMNDYKKYFIEKTLTIEEARSRNKYLLFRPIGLKLIAKLYVYYRKNEIIDDFLSDMNRISFKFPDSHLNKVLWNNGIMDVKTANQKLAYDLSLYVAGVLPEVYHNSLEKEYQTVLKNDTVELPTGNF